MSPRSKKMDSAIIIAIIGLAGTIIAALFNSQVLIAMIENKNTTPVPESDPSLPSDVTLVFDEDFEDNSADTFVFETGEGKIEKEKSNRVLNFNGITPDSDILARVHFGPQVFRDGIIEFSVKYIQLGGFYLTFRNQGFSFYNLYFMPDQILFGYNGKDANWKAVPFENGLINHEFQIGRWYIARVEARGADITFSLDGVRVFSIMDERIAAGNLSFDLDQGVRVLLDDIKVWAYNK